MLRLSWSTFTERWQLFIGAALTVCMGVALVQSALLVLISAATMEAPAALSPAQVAAFDNGTQLAVTISGLTLGFSVFLAAFVVGSTFAFTVAQRRSDLALLRLTGGSGGQLHRLLLGEAVLLGIVGTALGVPLGLLAMDLQSRMLTAFGFVPAGFTVRWQPWILGVSVGVGVGIALAGVLVAARRAARVQPLEALRDTGAAARVMTVGRWVVAVVFTAGAVAMFVLAPIAGAGGGQALTINAAMAAAVACTALAPLLVPTVAALLPAGGPLGLLARSNLRDGVRRTAATAGPLIVLSAIVISQAGTVASFSVASAAEQRRNTVADLVVESRGPVGTRIATVAGVALVDQEIELPIMVTSGEKGKQKSGSALAVDPDAYQRVHPESALPAGIGGRNIAGAGEKMGSVGETVGLRVGGTDLGTVDVVAEITSGPDQLLPIGLVPSAELADAASRTFVVLRPGADATAVAAALGGIGTVRNVDDWLARSTADHDAINTSVFLVIMGLGTTYALIGVINAVVIGAAARRSEFAVARATGLTRGQVVRMALLESSAVTFIGLLLGLVVAAGAFVSLASSTAAATGVATVAVPWTVVLAVVATGFVVTGLTSVLTTLAATRRRPVELLATAE